MALTMDTSWTSYTASASTAAMGSAAVRVLGMEDMRARRIKPWRETVVEGGPGVGQERGP
jgi:hypothetical protein